VENVALGEGFSSIIIAQMFHVRLHLSASVVRRTSGRSLGAFKKKKTISRNRENGEENDVLKEKKKKKTFSRNREHC
jgi:hypothetical protein